MNISSYRDFPLDKIIFEKPIRSKDNTYISEAVLRKENGETDKVIIQTPSLVNLEGIVRTGNRAYIELAIDKEHSDFYDFISNIDGNAMDIIEKNSESWFGQQFPRKVVEDFYRSILKPGREQTTPCMKLNLPIEDEEILVNFLNKDKKKCFYTEVPTKAKTVVVMQFIGLRFLKQQVLSMWRPIQVFVNDIIQAQEQPVYIQDNLLTDEEQETLEIPVEQINDLNGIVIVDKNPETTVDENILKEAPKEENLRLLIDENKNNMEPSVNPPKYDDVKNLLERTETENINPEFKEQQLLESINLELDEVSINEEYHEPEADEVPILTDDMLNKMEVEYEAEMEEEEASEDEEEGESTLEEYKEAFQYLENELEKRDEVIKTLKRQMSGMLSVLENVDDEQN